MTPAQLFTRAGILLYGDEFTAPLAKALNVERSTVRKMADGKSRVMPGMWLELAALIQDREAALPALKVAVLRAAEG